MNAFAPVSGLSVRTADPAMERVRLNAFVAAHPSAQFFHKPEWSLAVAQGTGQPGHFLVAEDEAGVAGLLPLTHVRSRLFGSALVSTGFGVGGGILASDPAAVEALAAEAWALARRLGCPSVELRGGPIPAGWRSASGAYASFSRDLPQQDAAVLKAIPRKQRAEIRRALGNGLHVSIGTGTEDRAGHYRVYAESVRNLGTPVFPRRLFEAALDAFGDDADILTVTKDGDPVASVLSFYFKGSVYPYWGGGTKKARALRANDLMYSELMRHALARGCTRFDFGRSKTGTGAYAFKKNWGFEPEPLTYAVKGEARETNPLNPKYRLQVALWQRLPLALANRLGPIISRGLG